jgi:hypothetical protein
MQDGPIELAHENRNVRKIFRERLFHGVTLKLLRRKKRVSRNTVELGKSFEFPL